MARSFPRLVLFPGLGIDHRLFLPQVSLPPKIEIPKWITPHPDEPLDQYARRLAATIEPSDNLYLGGVSFGAMIAMEAAAVLSPRAVFSIAACDSYRDFALPAQWACRSAGNLPTNVIEKMLSLTPLLLRLVGRPNRRQRKLLLSLVPDVDLSVARWGARAIMSWELSRIPTCPIHRIHGSDDRLIPLANVHPDAVVAGGGHIINVTHPAIVNAFIRSRLV